MPKLLKQECEIHVEPSTISDGQYVIFVNEADGNFLTSQDEEHELICDEIKRKLFFYDDLLNTLEEVLKMEVPPVLMHRMIKSVIAKARGKS